MHKRLLALNLVSQIACSSVGETSHERVRDGEMEIGVIGTRSDGHDGIQTGDELVYIFPKKHPIASKPKATLDDLRAQKFVSSEPGFGTRAAYEQAMVKKELAGA